MKNHHQINPYLSGNYAPVQDELEIKDLILDAINLKNEPLARIKLPRRIPNGLHGSWMPGVWE